MYRIHVPTYVEYCIVQPGHLQPNQFNHSRCGASSSVDFTSTEAVLGSSVWHIEAVQCFCATQDYPYILCVVYQAGLSLVFWGKEALPAGISS